MTLTRKTEGPMNSEPVIEDPSPIHSEAYDIQLEQRKKNENNKLNHAYVVRPLLQSPKPGPFNQKVQAAQDAEEKNNVTQRP